MVWQRGEGALSLAGLTAPTYILFTGKKTFDSEFTVETEGRCSTLLTYNKAQTG